MRFFLFNIKRRQVVVSCLVALIIAYLGLLWYIFHHREIFNESEEVAVLVTPPSDRGTGGSTVHFAPYQRRGVTPSVMHSTPTTVSHQLPTTNFRSTNTIAPVHTSSSAQVHNIGGGSSVGGSVHVGTSSVSNNVVNSPISVSTSAFVVPTLARVSSRNLNAETTRKAEQEVVEKNGPERRVTNRRNGGWDEYDQDPEPFPDEVPIGTPWILLLLAGGYTIKKRLN